MGDLLKVGSFGKPYQSRGSISSADKNKSHLPGTFWTDLDLTSIFGSGRKLLLLHLEMVSSAGTPSVQVRPNGFTGSYDDYTFQVFNVGSNTHCQVLVETDEDGLLEWYGDATNINVFALVVKGWWDL